MMTRRMAIAMSGVMAGSLMAGMVGAQLASAKLSSSGSPVKVVREVQTAPRVQPPPLAASFDAERE